MSLEMHSNTPFWICTNSNCKEQNSFERKYCKKCNKEIIIENKDRYNYFELCKRILTDSISNENLRSRFFSNPKSLSESEISLELSSPINLHVVEGDFWPEKAHTMIGILKLNNIQFCIEDVIKNNIEGDFIETGVWRGGATIFMRLILKEYEIKDRIVYVADSFQGIPEPDIKKYPVDKKDISHTFDVIKVSLEEVKSNFEKYGGLDNQVKFLKGWFEDSLRNPTFEKLSILRLDGDLYGSTWCVLKNLYDRLSIGGYVIIDDYALVGCRKAVDDFRLQNNIQEEIKQVDWTCIYWKKEKELSLNQDHALFVLLKRYFQRIDLQQSFPEVKDGNCQSLINWGASVVTKNHSDIDYELLSKFEEWFVSHQA